MKTSLIKIQAHSTSKQALDLSKFDSNFYSKGFIGLVTARTWPSHFKYSDAKNKSEGKTIFRKENRSLERRRPQLFSQPGLECHRDRNLLARLDPRPQDEAKCSSMCFCKGRWSCIALVQWLWVQQLWASSNNLGWVADNLSLSPRLWLRTFDRHHRSQFRSKATTSAFEATMRKNFWIKLNNFWCDGKSWKNFSELRLVWSVKHWFSITELFS